MIIIRNYICHGQLSVRSFWLVFFFFFLLKCGHVYMTKLLGFVLTASWFLSSFVIRPYSSPFWICRRVAEERQSTMHHQSASVCRLTVVFVMCQLSLCFEMCDPSCVFVLLLDCCPVNTYKCRAFACLIGRGWWWKTTEFNRQKIINRESDVHRQSPNHCVTTTHWRNNKDKRER